MNNKLDLLDNLTESDEAVVTPEDEKANGVSDKAEEAELKAPKEDEYLGTEVDADDVETEEDDLKDLSKEQVSVAESFESVLNSIISLLSEEDAELKAPKEDEYLGTEVDADDVETEEDDLKDLSKEDTGLAKEEKEAKKAVSEAYTDDELRIILVNSGKAGSNKNIKTLREQLDNGTYVIVEAENAAVTPDDENATGVSDKAEEAELKVPKEDEYLGTEVDADDVETEEDDLEDLKADQVGLTNEELSFLYENINNDGYVSILLAECGYEVNTENIKSIRDFVLSEDFEVLNDGLGGKIKNAAKSVGQTLRHPVRNAKKIIGAGLIAASLAAPGAAIGVSRNVGYNQGQQYVASELAKEDSGIFNKEVADKEIANKNKETATAEKAKTVETKTALEKQKEATDKTISDLDNKANGNVDNLTPDEKNDYIAKTVNSKTLTNQIADADSKIKNHDDEIAAAQTAYDNAQTNLDAAKNKVIKKYANDAAAKTAGQIGIGAGAAGAGIAGAAALNMFKKKKKSADTTGKKKLAEELEDESVMAVSDKAEEAKLNAPKEDEYLGTEVDADDVETDTLEDLSKDQVGLTNEVLTNMIIEEANILFMNNARLIINEETNETELVTLSADEYLGAEVDADDVETDELENLKADIIDIHEYLCNASDEDTNFFIDEVLSDNEIDMLYDYHSTINAVAETYTSITPKDITTIAINENMIIDEGILGAIKSGFSGLGRKVKTAVSGAAVPFKHVGAFATYVKDKHDNNVSTKSKLKVDNMKSDAQYNTSIADAKVAKSNADLNAKNALANKKAELKNNYAIGKLDTKADYDIAVNDAKIKAKQAKYDMKQSGKNKELKTARKDAIAAAKAAQNDAIAAAKAKQDSGEITDDEYERIKADAYTTFDNAKKAAKKNYKTELNKANGKTELKNTIGAAKATKNDALNNLKQQYTSDVADAAKNAKRDKIEALRKNKNDYIAAKRDAKKILLNNKLANKQNATNQNIENTKIIKQNLQTDLANNRVNYVNNKYKTLAPSNNKTFTTRTKKNTVVDNLIKKDATGTSAPVVENFHFNDEIIKNILQESNLAITTDNIAAMKNNLCIMLNESVDAVTPEDESVMAVSDKAEEAKLNAPKEDEYLGTEVDADDVETEEDKLEDLAKEQVGLTNESKDEDDSKENDEDEEDLELEDDSKENEECDDEEDCKSKDKSVQEAFTYGSLLEAADAPVGYFDDKDHFDRLKGQVACTIAKENDDLLFGELERAVALVNAVKDKIIAKYGNLAGERANDFVNGIQALTDETCVKRGMFAHLGEQIEINNIKKKLAKPTEKQTIYEDIDIFDKK